LKDGKCGLSMLVDCKKPRAAEMRGEHRGAKTIEEEEEEVMLNKDRLFAARMGRGRVHWQ
jgi:hypothetical protein